jgi:hypothetical protein
VARTDIIVLLLVLAASSLGCGADRELDLPPGPACAPPGTTIGQLAYSTDGAWLAAAHSDGQVTVMSPGGAGARRWRVTSAGLPRIALTENGALLAAGSAGQVGLWKVADATVVRQLPVGSGDIVSLKFSDAPEPFLLASVSLAADLRDNLKIWRISDGVLVGLITGAAEATFTHADEAVLLLDEAQRRFDVVSFQGRSIKVGQFPQAMARTAFAADGAFMAGVLDAGTAQERLATISVGDDKFVWEATARVSGTRALVFLENPSRVVQLAERVLVYDHTDGQVITELPPLRAATLVTAAPDGSALAAADAAGNVVVVSSTDGTTRAVSCVLR